LRAVDTKSLRPRTGRFLPVIYGPRRFHGAHRVGQARIDHFGPRWLGETLVPGRRRPRLFPTALFPGSAVWGRTDI